MGNVLGQLTGATYALRYVLTPWTLRLTRVGLRPHMNRSRRKHARLPNRRDLHLGALSISGLHARSPDRRDLHPLNRECAY